MARSCKRKSRRGGYWGESYVNAATNKVSGFWPFGKSNTSQPRQNEVAAEVSAYQTEQSAYGGRKRSRRTRRSGVRQRR